MLVLIPVLCINVRTHVIVMTVYGCVYKTVFVHGQEILTGSLCSSIVLASCINLLQYCT